MGKWVDVNLWYEKLIYYNCRLNKKGMIGKTFSVLFHFIIRLVFNCDISPNAEIGTGIKIPHCVGIVIGATAVIGKNCVIMPNVIVGSKKYPAEKNIKRHATIGDNCLIGANAIIIGDIFIAENTIVGAGAYLDKDVPGNSTLIRYNRVVSNHK